MGLFGASGKHKLKNAMSSSTSVTNTAMSGSTTNQRAEAHANAKTVFHGDVNLSGNAAVEIMSTAEVQQEVKAMKTQTNIIDLENDILTDVEQKPSADITGGLFSPDIDSDNSLNVSSTASTASANYSYMSVSALATADADMEFFGNITASGNATLKTGAAASVHQELKMTQNETIEQSGLNTLKTEAEQAPKVVAKDAVVETAKTVASTIDNAVNKFAGLLSGPFMVVAGLVGLAVLMKMSGGGGGGGTADASKAAAAMQQQGLSPAKIAEEASKAFWLLVLKRANIVFAIAVAVLALVNYGHDIWASKYNLLKYVAKYLFKFEGIPEIPDEYWWGITLVYGGYTVLLHVIFIKT